MSYPQDLPHPSSSLAMTAARNQKSSRPDPPTPIRIIQTDSKGNKRSSTTCSYTQSAWDGKQLHRPEGTQEKSTSKDCLYQGDFAHARTVCTRRYQLPGYATGLRTEYLVVCGLKKSTLLGIACCFFPDAFVVTLLTEFMQLASFPGAQKIGGIGRAPAVR